MVIFDVGYWPFKVDMDTFELVTMAPLLVGIIVIGIWPAFILTGCLKIRNGLSMIETA